MRFGAIVQARMNSTRLPGKVLMEIGEDETVLELLIKRLKLCKFLDVIIIATTPAESNSQIIDLTNNLNVKSFIGSENNVLKRFYDGAKKFELDIVIRICSDNPFIDPKILDEIIAFFNNNNYDYVSTSSLKTNLPLGSLIEIFPFKILEKVYQLAETVPDKEHVTYFIQRHPKLFSIYFYNLKNFEKIEDLRMTIDQREDLEFCKEIYKRLKGIKKDSTFSLFDIIKIIKKEPDLMKINKHVLQKII